MDTKLWSSTLTEDEQELLNCIFACAGFSSTGAGFSSTSAGFSSTSAGFSSTGAGFSSTGAGFSSTSAGLCHCCLHTTL